jgi:hypothetical protein
VTTRTEGERIRARQHLALLRAMLDSAEIALDLEGVPPGSDLPQSLQLSAGNLAASLIRMDAYMISEGFK